VMAPMVATVAEAADFAARVRSRGLVPGVMIEIPSAALLAERLLDAVDFLSIGTNDLSQYALAADRLSADLADLTDPWQPALLAHRMLECVDFLSIGTNDLTQYTMAADRMAADLAHLTDPWQPAVLQLIAITAEAGRQAGKPVGVCGEAAADPLLACVLVGMGITSLSMAAAAVRPVGARLATVPMDVCEDAAEAALAASDPMAARDAVRRVLGA